jgi:transposase-like protein
VGVSVPGDSLYEQVIDVLVSEKRDLAATRRFFTHPLKHGPRPIEASTDRASAYRRVIDELLPAYAMLWRSTRTTRRSGPRTAQLH